MTHDILTLATPEVLNLYRRKKLSPVEVASAVYAQIEKYNVPLNAFALVAEQDKFMLAALESETRWVKGRPNGMLDGIPTTIKDTVDVAGWPTRDGSAITPDKPAAEDAPLVANLRAAGAMFIGKTRLPEFGHKGVTDSPAFGITRNPWNPEKTCGGSSGGAAVAAATRMGFLHMGSDGGGSIRIPASFCGVFGIKPTQGLVPTKPNLFSSLASSGPLTRGVEDAAVMLGALSGHTFEAQKLKGLRVAYVTTYNDIPVDPDVATLVADAARMLGAVEIRLELPRVTETFNRHWMAVAMWILEQIPTRHHDKMDPRMLHWAERGAALGLKEYLDAQLDRLRLAEQMKALFESYDLLLTPTTAMTAFDAGVNMPPHPAGGLWDDWTPFTYIANLATLPAASLPCGLTREGLPAGVQILAATGNDALVLNAARVLEKEIGFKDWLARNYSPHETKRRA